MRLPWGNPSEENKSGTQESRKNAQKEITKPNTHRCNLRDLRTPLFCLPNILALGQPRSGV